MYSLGSIEKYIDFAKSLGCSRLIEISIEPREFDRPFQCHNNCQINPKLGVYFVEDSVGLLHAFKHSVLDLGDDKLIDVTPTLDNRQYNIFGYGFEVEFEHYTYANSTVYINKQKKEESELMYYVYALIDPRTNQPFYIGKGKDDRALSHFKESALEKEGNTRKTSKIKKLKSLGYNPVIEFYAQNIVDEDLDYSIESFYIKK